MHTAAPIYNERSVRSETASIGREILQYLMLARQKPYMSYWGELFYLLYQIRRKSEAMKQDLPVYVLPSGQMIYSWAKCRFIAILPDMNIHLTEQELVDALLKGILVPSDS